MYSEKIVVGAGSEYPLNGLMTLPSDLSNPVPAVVMVHGSGASNMDEKVMKLTPFKDLAEGLARHGIASLRYDKRTFVHARRMIRNKHLTVKEETIEDALLAVQMLKRDPRIDHDRIYILGHSMGAMLAPRIDQHGSHARSEDRCGRRGREGAYNDGGNSLPPRRNCAEAAKTGRTRQLDP